MNTQKIVMIFLTILSGALLLHHQTIFQPILAQGDHGRDLYAFWATMEGKIPYRDYWWVYGPLTPYYYAAVQKVLGVSIHSVLLGQYFLKLTSGVFIFLALANFIPTIIAYVAALWFWMFYPDFFFTYSHTAGITLLMAITYLVFRYIKDVQQKLLYWALFCALLLCFVKLNFGIVAWFVVMAFTLGDIFLNHRDFKEKKVFFLTGILLFPVVVFLIYAALLHGLPIYAIRQCLPYLGDDQPYNAPLSMTASMLFNALAATPFVSWSNFLMATIVITSFVKLLSLFRSSSVEKNKKLQIGSALMLLASIYFLNLHEYLKSGVLYRLNWSTPFSLLLLFFIIGVVLTDKNRIWHWLFSAFLIVSLIPVFSGEIATMKSQKIPQQYFTFPQGKIIAGNDLGWFDTVKSTVGFLNQHLKPGETFFALPYDPLYYFLTQRLSPTRMLIFFDHIKIPHEQDQSIIAELEKNNVQYVVLSSRSQFNTEHGLGTFGVTYCPVLAKYLEDHFQPVAIFGDWTHEPGWAWNHGTKIFRRVK